jgi:hypothetical protein
MSIKMTGFANANDDISVRGPGDVFHIGKKELQRVPVSPNGLETGAGDADQLGEAEKFKRQQSAKVNLYIVNPHFWLPEWVRQHISSGGSVEGLLQDVIKRVKDDPHEQTLQEAQFIVNELGRNPENSRVITKYITRSLIKQVAELGRNRA